MKSEEDIKKNKKINQCEKCINEYSSMDDEPYLCDKRPCPLTLVNEEVKI